MNNLIYQKKEKFKNINRAYSYIAKNNIFTKKELSTSLNVSFPTATKIINILLEKGIILDSGFSSENIKRKALLYKYNPNSFYSIGIKVELHSISFILINLSGIEIKKTVIIKEFFNDNNFVQYISEQLKIFLLNFEYMDKIIGIGISLSGIVNNKKKIFEIGTNFNIFAKNFDILEKAFKLPVYLINEANAGALGEFFLKEPDSHNNLAFISIESGIGAGIMLNGNMYLGSTSKAGEFGHFTVEIDGRACNCGNHGCLETYCSNEALVKTFEKEFDLKNLSFIEIFSKKLYETKKGKEIFDKYTTYLASSIRSLLFILDLDKIIIGGLISNYSFVIEDELKRKIFNNIFFKDKNILEFSSYGDFSNLIGAAFLPVNHFLEKLEK
ncbi:ROK family protein [Fusobacterium sp. MFO224]|uniref:ROK family protein n=1 Tax=Fusobacterium sp. MFO224 TaxID=3378070 RepID=UPI003852972B